MKECKRKHVDWYDLIFNLGRDDVWASFMLFRKKHIGMSWNRCAWNVLKNYYSTTALRYYREFGKFPSEDSL